MYGTNTDAGSGLGTAGLLVVALLYAAAIAFSIYIYVRVAHKAGYSGWYVLLMFVPLVNLVFIILFAFKEWPIEAENRQLKARLSSISGGPQTHLGQQDGYGPQSSQGQQDGYGPQGNQGQQPRGF